MIDARELRIGNKVINNHTNTIYTVKSINVTDIGYSGFLNGHIWPLESVDEQPLDAYGIGFGVLDPIPLTPEILEKWCGFNDGEIRISDNTYLILDEDEGYNVFIKQFNAIGSTPDIETVLMPKCIKYLHQLQNLIYALTGEELKVNYEKK